MYTNLDYAVFLAAGTIATFWDQRVAWGLIAFWSLLKLVKVL